jgi:hypothetical protein
VVVAVDHEHAAVGMGAGVVAVLHCVAGAVDPRSLAVPDREDTVDVGVGQHIELLRAPDGCGGKVFVDPGLEDDSVVVEVRLRLPQCRVVPTDG